MLIPFESVQENDKKFGGKAWGLALLAQKGFPVPAGLVIDEEPTEEEWNQILEWWKKNESTPLAVRSSAGAEDSAENSFAGQNRSFLNVKEPEELKQAILDCFASYYRDNSKAYRKFFKGNSATGKMNIVIQKMVQPKYAGVFFSEDPMGKNQGWILEVIEGLGEDLVSGKVTPGRMNASGKNSDLPAGFSKELADEVCRVGEGVSKALNFPVDMEWAFDEKNIFYVLQARPITTLSSKTDWVNLELKRLEKKYTDGTTWDGQTFAEWSGLPSYLTFSIWRGAFSPHHAFGNALKEVGYRSFIDSEWRENDSILGRVFGRAYVNLDKMSDLYYGSIPYKIVAKPRPHTKFDFSKITIKTILNFPSAILSMLRVAWNLSTKRTHFYNRCKSELLKFRSKFSRPLDKEAIKSYSTERLFKILSEEAEEFAKVDLHWPFVLVILTEYTMQNLRVVTKGVFADKADQKIREWMAKGLHTVTLDMQKEYSEACIDKELQPQFLARYGHRGPGEMDLSNPRWFEMGEQAFVQYTSKREWTDHATEVEDEIKAIASFKRDMILDEWRWLKRLLETREMWKMQLLKPYAHIRLVVEELGIRLEIGSLIHWLRLSEILNADNWSNDTKRKALLEKIRSRQEKFKAFRKYSFPDIITLQDIREMTQGKISVTGKQLDGEPLSPGLAYGEVRFVDDPQKVDLSQWPKDTIIVAETTDPGWTALFVQAKGIVVERGGVLSHCSILSREMGLPAVGNILSIRNKLKDGDKIWVDGNSGRVSRE
ncbi:MAG: PEP-utilizing enzyme [Oligoflexia bacterium]|nr:PEP-utilizing enzyme [Oligoflexia bacterium]